MFSANIILQDLRYFVIENFKCYGLVNGYVLYSNSMFQCHSQLRSVEETTQAMAFDGIILEVQLCARQYCF